MKIDIEINGNDYILSMFTAITLQNLQWDAQHWLEWGYTDEKEQKKALKRIKAAKLLIKYYKEEERNNDGD